MSMLSLRIPTSLHQELRHLARREGVSVNQLVSAALGEKIASFKMIDYLQERANRASRAKFDAVLAKVPDVDPEEFDRLPDPQLQPPKTRRKSVKKATTPARLRG